jgi:hypothetical protein
MHWMIENIRKDNPTAFIPMIQHHWAQDYSSTCQSRRKVKQALMESKVPCQHQGLEQLHKTWFPAPLIVKKARKYGVHKRLPILDMPESNDEYRISQWPCLTELGVRSTPDLTFYRQTISSLSIAEQAPATKVTTMGSLYKSIGSLVTLEDQAMLKVGGWLALAEALLTTPRKILMKTPSPGIQLVGNGAHWTNVSGKAGFH